MAAPAKPENPTLAANRKARHDYAVLDRIEAGIALVGTEVKSVRNGKASLAGGFARIEQGEAWLHHVNISPYDHGNVFNHEPDRPRRLLLHRQELRSLAAETEQKGLTLVPLRLYLKRGRIKVELGLCRGKTHGDKRETLRRKTADQEARRAVARSKRS